MISIISSDFGREDSKFAFVPMTLASSRPRCPRSCFSAPKHSASRRTKSSSSRNAPSRTPSQVTTKNAPSPRYSRTFEEKKKREKNTHHLQYSFFIVFIS
uniref:(northern house mosquito) hypothetical protein n=1 Tax=Culex pipiens TaxID=7175 RepID=A0A8D8P731_CULPI